MVTTGEKQSNFAQIEKLGKERPKRGAANTVREDSHTIRFLPRHSDSRPQKEHGQDT